MCGIKRHCAAGLAKKWALRGMIVAAVAEQEDASGAAEAEAAAKAARLAQLKQELSGLKLRALQQKAAEAGIAEDMRIYEVSVVPCPQLRPTIVAPSAQTATPLSKERMKSH